MTIFSQAFHVAALALYMVNTFWIKEHFFLYKDRTDLDTVHKHCLRNFLRFLTVWVYILQIVYFAIAVLKDILNLLKGLKRTKLQVNKITSYFFTVIAAPWGLMVAVTFWLFMLVDRELVYPQILDILIPPWLNHALHTTTGVLIFLEMYITPQKYPPLKSVLWGIFLFTVTYSICLFGTYLQNNEWLYPVFRIESWPLRISIFVLYNFVTVAFYGIGYHLNEVMWGKRFLINDSPKKNKIQ